MTAAAPAHQESHGGITANERSHVRSYTPFHRPNSDATSTYPVASAKRRKR
jgi:hypothetical protein